jgi:hypothetical protein
VRTTLQGGPSDGIVIDTESATIVVPFLRPNDDGTDQTLGEWMYHRSGPASPVASYAGERIRTTTANADEWARTLEYWRHQDEAMEELGRYRARFGPLDDDDD